MAENFYCTKCAMERPVEGSITRKLKRGTGWAEVRQCSICSERAKGSAADREKRAHDEACAKRKARSYAKRTTEERPKWLT